jgi:cytochrome c5
LRQGRSSLIFVSAVMLACLTAFAALAQSRNNTPARRPAPDAQPSGHQTEAVDLNEGKSAAELFQAGCAVCHQSPAGLAKGRRDSELAGFLRQHYTSGTQHAAVLAGFLAAAGGGRGGPAATGPARVNPNAPIDRPPAPIGDRKPAQEAARPQEREPAAKRRPPEKPPVAARAAPPAAATEAAAHPGDAPAAAPVAPPPPPPEEKPAPPEIPL